MNKWKLAFGCCFTVLVIVTVVGIYSIIDQSVTLTYMKEGYTNTENDLESILNIINKTDQSKEQIKKVLKTHKLYEYMNFNNDTISLDRVTLIFKNDKLFKVSKQW